MQLVKFMIDTIFFARFYEFVNPALYKSISVMKTESGTTIEIDLNRFFKLSGSSVLPA